MKSAFPNVIVLLFTLTVPAPLAAQTFRERFDDWPLETTIGGTICFAFELNDLTPLRRVCDQLDNDVTLTVLGSDLSQHEELKEVFRRHHIEVLNDEALISERHTDARAKMFSADHAVCWLRSDELSDVEADALMSCRELIHDFLHRGGTFICVGPVARRLGILTLGHDSAAARRGLDLVPDAIIIGEETSDHSLNDELKRNPRTVGLRLASQAMVILNGRKVYVANEGHATFVLPEAEHCAARSQTISSQRSARQDPNEYLVDLTQWRREAIERTLEPFPGKTPELPGLTNGTLMIVGGGGLPEGLMDRFISIAGGREEARLVYIPCSEARQISRPPRMVQQWKSMGVQHATWIHTKDRQVANSDPAILKTLSKATGLWFGGGRQWNLADSYYGTEAHRQMKNVLHRGGIVGGSSAGASIQARYLARATPIQNLRIIAPGYERGGLGFLTGVAIDQHFSARKRQPDMSLLIDRYPQLLGIGIDEATALVVQKSRAEIVGEGRVFFYDRQSQQNDNGADFLSLPEGSAYDLRRRNILSDTRETHDESGSENR